MILSSSRRAGSQSLFFVLFVFSLCFFSVSLLVILQWGELLQFHDSMSFIPALSAPTLFEPSWCLGVNQEVVQKKNRARACDFTIPADTPKHKKSAQIICKTLLLQSSFDSLLLNCLFAFRTRFAGFLSGYTITNRGPLRPKCPGSVLRGVSGLRAPGVSKKVPTVSPECQKGVPDTSGPKGPRDSCSRPEGSQW